MTAPDLVAFLRARIDEDEDVAKRAAFGWGSAWTAVVADEWSTISADGSPRVASSEDGDVMSHAARWDPARVLAEVAAKRAIIDALVWFTPDTEWSDFAEPGRGVENPATDALRAMARVFAGHPDFDSAWKASTS